MDGQLLKENFIHGRMVGDTEDALTAVWPVAGGNRRVWNEAAAATAGSDVWESQETVGGLRLGLQRWMVVEIFRKTCCFSPNSISLC